MLTLLVLFFDDNSVVWTNNKKNYVHSFHIVSPYPLKCRSSLTTGYISFTQQQQQTLALLYENKNEHNGNDAASNTSLQNVEDNDDEDDFDLDLDYLDMDDSQLVKFQYDDDDDDNDEEEEEEEDDALFDDGLDMPWDELDTASFPALEYDEDDPDVFDPKKPRSVGEITTKSKISAPPPSQQQHQRTTTEIKKNINTQNNNNNNIATTLPKLNNNKSKALKKDDPEWKFFDTARMHVQGGDGGTGCVAFRREKGEARGGPNGGRGGRGGSIYLIGDATLNTLMPIRQKVHQRAPSGKNGTGKNRDGNSAPDLYVPVPIGTVVRDLQTQKLAGEIHSDKETLLVAKGGRGGRGNAAFMTARRTAPKLAERGEPGTARWLSIELKLVADVGFLGKPNAGKSTLLAAASAARPKIADYPFTTIVPNLGVCDLGDGAGLVLCDIPGLIEGAANGAGMGGAFLRHVQRCRVLLHVVDGTSDDPIGDFRTINKELKDYDEFLSNKPQVVVLNKMDVPEVAGRADDLIEQLKQEAGHTRVLSISAATTLRVKELMSRLRKFVTAQPISDIPLAPEIDLSKAGLDYDSDDFSIQSDPSYPGQWRVKGQYIEQIARMTHWEYPEAVERFGRQLQALGIAAELSRRGAKDGDLIMIDEFDFDFSPGLTNIYIPTDLLEKDELFQKNRQVQNDDTDEAEPIWRPYRDGGYLDVDTEELVGFGEVDDWDLLEDDNDFDEKGNFIYNDDEIWTA
jgi:GTP-binding protein